MSHQGDTTERHTQPSKGSEVSSNDASRDGKSSGHCSVESCGIRNSTRSAKQKASITYMITTFTGSNPYSWHESSLQHQEHQVRFHSPLKMTDTRTVFARNRVDSTSAERMSLTPTPMALCYDSNPPPHLMKKDLPISAASRLRLR